MKMRVSKYNMATEIYRDVSLSSLLALWVEAPEDSKFRSEIWEDVLKLEKRDSKNKLLIVREKLDNIIKIKSNMDTIDKL